MKRDFLMLVALAAVLITTGCAQLNAAAGSRLDDTIENTKAANDNIAKGVKAAVCGVSFGAVMRDSELKAVAEPLCTPKSK
ncbi:hypothetical protein [Candidatus Nitrotoga sp. M5]|uniref:hypothetical protein n=1 Tax=Candidatus Nitrotoga sp. M5 TaxID=2890409 RepID=UPI001EF40CAA|nr:hypothetical protein [Candidatus Nitrotoga sp. M5]CAH1387023.1 exported hypothetical protein [Candidatus Nitrotoga sp. M5]